MRGAQTQPRSGWRIGRIVWAILATLLVIIGAVGWYAGFHDRGMNLDFNPDAVAEVETRMWQAYYGGWSKVALGMDLLKLMRDQFGLSYNTAIHVAQDVASATVAFRTAGGQSDYEQKVLPDLIRGYTRLHHAVRGSWDPEEVARAELDWWVARRAPDRSAPEIVGAAIAHEYALVYGKDNEHVRRAGLLRAQAAHLRDRGAQGNTDWPAIAGMLRESYRELSQGIHE